MDLLSSLEVFSLMYLAPSTAEAIKLARSRSSGYVKLNQQPEIKLEGNEKHEYVRFHNLINIKFSRDIS